MPKTSKWRLIVALVIVTIASFAGGVIVKFAPLYIAAFVFLYMVLGVMACGDKKEKNYGALLLDGAFWNLI